MCDAQIDVGHFWFNAKKFGETFAEVLSLPGLMCHPRLGPGSAKAFGDLIGALKSDLKGQNAVISLAYQLAWLLPTVAMLF